MSSLGSPTILESSSNKDDSEMASKETPNTNCSSLGDNLIEAETIERVEMQEDINESHFDNQTQQTSHQHASLCNSNMKDGFSSQASKTPKTKQKKGRPSKRKPKRVDYTSNLTDGRSIEQIMDLFTQHFKSLDLYDNPKTLERWSVLNSEEERKGEEGKETYEEKKKWEDERRELLQRIAKFIYIMTRSQGPRDFVKWNGSVVDSVVGVFLTQNVSDVLSSNAYMKLGSRYPLKSSSKENGVFDEDSEINNSEGSSSSRGAYVVVEPPDEEEEATGEVEVRSEEFDAALKEMLDSVSDLKASKGKGKHAEEREKIDWEAIRVKYAGEGKTERPFDARDSVDWEAVRNAPVKDIAEAIHGRGQHTIIAEKIKKTLNRLVEQHGCLDLEWLRKAPPQVAKAYLLSFYGLGLKSVECLRLLTLHHHAFPVDVNIGRIAIRLGWVPIKPLPMGLHFHLLEKYPLENEIQQYLWPRLCHLDQKILYKLHYHMITFGKIFCVKKNPNCGACPFKGECKYYASVVASKLALPKAEEKRMTKSKRNVKRFIRNPFDIKRRSSSRNLSIPASNYDKNLEMIPSNSIAMEKNEPIVEMPPSPSPDPEVLEPKVTDIEDLFTYDNNDVEEELYEIKLSTEEFKQTFWNYIEENNVPLNKNDDISRALVSLSPEDVPIPLAKHMVIARLRTEHQVYELPDGHPLLKDLDRRDEKDPLPYLLAIWTSDQIRSAETLQECGACSNEPCSEDRSLTIPGTFLIPSRTALRGSFPLNGTYFQVNEVFIDDETSEQPINVPRAWIWNLPRRTMYCGYSTTSIFRGLTWREIQRCCYEGFICTRGFNRQTRGPKPLPLRFHNRPRYKSQQDEEDDDR